MSTLADLEFNTTEGRTIARELLIAYLNTGTPEEPVWSAIGKRVEESDEEMDWSEESIKDILGTPGPHSQNQSSPRASILFLWMQGT